MKKHTRKTDIIIIIVLLLIIAVLAVPTVIRLTGQKNADSHGTSSGSLTYTDYNGKNIGILTGSSFEPLTLAIFPDSQYLYYNSFSDLCTALKLGKIDAFICDVPILKKISAEQPDIGYLDDLIDSDNYCFAFRKDDSSIEKICGQFNDFLSGLRSDGTLEKIENVWFGDDESLWDIDRSGITGENGHLTAVVCSSSQPFTFIRDGEITGMTIDIFVRFCREYGYSYEIEDVDVAAMLAGITSGKYDVSPTSLSFTEERSQSVLFSDPFYSAGMELAVRAEDIDGAEYQIPEYSTIAELNKPERSIGVGTGSAAMFKVEQIMTDARIVYFGDKLTGMEAVRRGTSDAFAFDRRQLQKAIDTGFSGVMVIDENLGDDTEVAVGLSKKTSVPFLKDKINEFIAAMKESGINDDSFRRWVIDSDYEMPDIPAAKDPTFTIKVGTTGVYEPYSFYKDNDLAGYDIEMAKRFASWINADIEFKVYDYSGVIAAAEAGEIDCIFANLNKTEERMEVIDFSDDMYTEQTGLLVRIAGNNEEKTEFFESIVQSFEKNFIREERWKLILDGIGTTCIITVMSTLFGSVIAFLICMFRRTGSSLANSVSDIYVKLLQGMPMVVLLMILYYVILGKSELPSVWVAVVGFSLNFGAYASEIMCSGIESIDGGQREAALALGYSENQAFFRFVFPQALLRFFPVYIGEIVSMLKGTSVVGYIAIQDLTKMSDIIRSRTYEAFFPLIATAVVYFVLAWILSVIPKLILNLLSSSRKKGSPV